MKHQTQSILPSPPASAAPRAGSSRETRWIPVCSVEEVPEGGARAVHCQGLPIAVFRRNGEWMAVDNRCPHMGYPLTKGSIKDGILVCHWHHWQFDVKSGACFVNGGDDVQVFPVQVNDGQVSIGFSADQEDRHSRLMQERGMRALLQGLKEASPFLIAKAVMALRASGVTPRAIVHQGIVWGVTRTNAGWSSGLAILGIAANLWNEIEAEDQNLFLVHGLSQIGNKNMERSSRRRQFPFAGEGPLDLVTLKRWFRRFIAQRGNTAGPERILMTLADRGCDRKVIADFMFTTATDFYFTGDGHALDFANKALEALDFIEWKDATEVLRPIVIDLISRQRHEETDQWAESVPVLEDTFKRLDSIWTANQTHSAPLDHAAFAQTLLGEDSREIVAAVEETLRAGVKPAELCRALVYAAALRITRFHLKNEGDWHAVANLYSYAHALYRAFQIAPSQELLRGIFHGAVYCYLIRWLNMPQARVPAADEGKAERFPNPQAMLARLQEMADFQKVYEAEVIVHRYLADGHDERLLRRTLAHILLREDAELHMFQILEVAFVHCDLTGSLEEKRVHLLAATRYITAQKVMKGILWSTQNAERLQRGESLSDREDQD